MAKMTAKKRNPPDLTPRNLRAIHKRLKAVEWWCYTQGMKVRIRKDGQ